jgi:hypothetical protein
MAKKQVVEDFQVGDWVKISHYGINPGKVIELRGPLGPGGMQIYLVRVRGKGRPKYIELRADQLKRIPADA